MRHVYDFIDDESTDRYAASWFESFSRPAIDKLRKPDTRKLFATYEGKRYRVTGCSRLGDVWLTADFTDSWHREDGKPEGLASELADTVIRIADMCGTLGIDLESAVVEKLAFNRTRPTRHGGKKL